MYLEEQGKKMTESILKFPLLYHSAKEVGNSGKKKQVEEFKIYSYVSIWNKIIEQEFQNIFCHSLAISIHILVLPLLFYMT